MTNGTVLVVVALVVLLGGALYFLSAGNSSPIAPANKEFTLKVADKKLIEGPGILRVKQGDMVTIKITSDEAEEFHLHGYDRSVDLIPDQEATLTFVADASGRFIYELEESKVELGALEVLP